MPGLVFELVFEMVFGAEGIPLGSAKRRSGEWGRAEFGAKITS